MILDYNTKFYKTQSTHEKNLDSKIVISYLNETNLCNNWISKSFVDGIKLFTSLTSSDIIFIFFFIKKYVNHHNVSAFQHLQLQTHILDHVVIELLGDEDARVRHAAAHTVVK